VNGQVVVSDWQDNLNFEPGGNARSGSGAPRSAAYDGRGFGAGVDINMMPTPQTGTQYSEALALTSATAYACSRARAETLGSLPAIVYQQATERIRQRARGTDPWRLLYDDPNPFMDATCFYELMNMRMVNRGNAFAEIERDRADNPIALWPIHPSRVLARSERDGNSNRWRLYWDVMTDVRDPSGQSYIMHRVEDRNMLNVCGFGGNGVIAPGVIDMGREEIALDLATRTYGSKFFKKGGKPQAVIEHPGYIDDDDQRRDFRSDMNRILEGEENWHGTPIMWNAAKYKEIQVDPQRAMFLESRAFSALQVCRLWNVAPPIVQIFADYKAKSIDEIIMMFVKHTVRPDAVRVERGVSRKVLSYRDDRGRLKAAFDGEFFLEFLLEGLLRGDAKKQAETLEIKRRNGVTNANEWREKDNENPLPGDQGEKYVLPGGFGDLATLGAMPDVKPSNGNGGSDNASASGHVPMFDRGQVINAVDRAIGPRRNIARGASLQKESTRDREKRLVRSMALNQLTEAVDRISAVLENERERLAAKGQALAKINWDRHFARLESALLPGCKSYAILSAKIAPIEMANRLAMLIVGQQKASDRDGPGVDYKPLRKLAAAAAKGIIDDAQATTESHDSTAAG
jgi:HK97 family phage portal protein